jgi:hypothetical protein
VEWGDALFASSQVFADLLNRILQTLIFKGATQHGEVHLLLVSSVLGLWRVKEGRHHKISGLA